MSGFLDVCFSNIKLSINPAMSGVNAIFFKRWLDVPIGFSIYR